MATRTADQYWEQVKTLPVFEQDSGAGDGHKTILLVDWSSIFSGTSRQSASYVLGFDPVDTNMVDPQAQYLSLADWQNKIVNEKIEAIDARVKALEAAKK